MRDTIRKSANRYSRKHKSVSNETAAANCRALLASMTTAGRVDCEQFVAEMQARSMEYHAKPLPATSVHNLHAIIDAYETELTRVSV